MKLNRDKKFGEESTCLLKIGMKNLTNFDLSKVSKIFTLVGSFWAKYILFELKNYRGVIFHETEYRDKKFEEESTCCLKIGIKNLTNFDLNT